jgi:hypothetical protein
MTKNKQSQTQLNQAALEKENFRLQCKIAKLEAKLVSAESALRALPPYSEPIETVTVEQVNEAFQAMKRAVAPEPPVRS